MNAVDRALPLRARPVLKPIIRVDDSYSPVFRAVSWAAACLVTLAIHGGLFWYFTSEQLPAPPSNVEEPAAVMIDMAPEVQQAFSENDQAVARPVQEAAETTPPPPDEPKPDPVPAVEESPVPAIAPLPPKPTEQPKPEKPPEKKAPPKPKKPVRKPSSKSASRTASGPRSDQHAERTTAASEGVASAESVADWRSQVAAALNRNKRYPGGADVYGIPTIRMMIGRSGAVSGVTVVSTSGSSELDSAAVETVMRSSPLPPPPAGTSSLTFRMNFHRR